MRQLTLCVLLVLCVFVSGSTGEDRSLFRFDTADAANDWRTVNDGVMGGRSTGSVLINDQQRLEFFGKLSLENNGGFASIRARGTKLALQPGEVVVARVKGDGREYQFNVYTQPNLGGVSFRQPFKTRSGEWIEVRFPVDAFVATWRGRQLPDKTLDPSQVAGMGFLLGDKKPGPFKLEVEWIKVRRPFGDDYAVECEGSYPQHLQGVCTDGKSLYWSFTTTLVRTDLAGHLQQKVPVADHHGDLCCHDGMLYVAVNLGKFNDPEGNAESWVFVYDAETLEEFARHQTQEVFHGAGGIGFRNGHFFVVGGLPTAVTENYVYEYTGDFKFLKRHVIASGHTHLGIQTATFAHGLWWFGCYGEPQVLLVTDAQFAMQGRHELDCSLGIEGLPGGRLLVASGRCTRGQGCTGQVRLAFPNRDTGFSYQSRASP